MSKELKQLVPPDVCLECDVCCRYPEYAAALSPYFFQEEASRLGEDVREFIAIGKMTDPKIPLEPCQDHYICPFFVPDRNACRIYDLRPLDCRLYPFMVTFDEGFGSIVLAVDRKCPYIKDRLDSKILREYADYLASLLEDDDIVDKMNYNKNFINGFQEDSLVLKNLEGLTKRVMLSEYKMRKISLKDKRLFYEYLSRCGDGLSSFSFAGIYIWSRVLNILWKEIGEGLCVFAGCDRDYFLLLPPLSDRFDKGVWKESLDILSSINGPHSNASRIENIPKRFLRDAAGLGLERKLSSEEYVYRQNGLAELKGDGFKSKRSLINYFKRNYEYIYRPFDPLDASRCLELYKEWASMRLKNKEDDYYRVLIEDWYFAQKESLTNAGSLGLEGRVIEIEGKIKAYTLGYPLNEDVFVIAFETTDLKIKGLSQFIFNEFSKELARYKYINTLGDSGLQNLKNAKDSYRPIKRIPAFAARCLKV